MRIDLHTHSDVSDGTDAPSELVAKAKHAGLDVVALTDHDTFDGLDEAVAAGDRLGVEVVRGIELSTRFGGQSVHLLAYGPDERHPGLNQEMQRIRDGRSMRLAPVLERLAVLGLPLTEEAVLAQVGGSPSVGRPHIADALVSAGYVADRAEAFDRFLADGGPAHVPRYAVALGRGIDLVHDAGGVAVIAHPWGRGRERNLTEAVLAELVAEHGLDGFEVDHQDHDVETRARLRRLADRLGVLGTGSSDYHGTGKVDHDLGCNTTSVEVFSRLRGRLAPQVVRKG
jgi:predicted metal-dependent phosphoesterase TrpH